MGFHPGRIDRQTLNVRCDVRDFCKLQESLEAFLGAKQQDLRKQVSKLSFGGCLTSPADEASAEEILRCVTNIVDDEGE